jgi:hypothetical protein
VSTLPEGGDSSRPAGRPYRPGMPRRRVRALRHRHGGVRRLFWPAGDFTASATPLEEYPAGYFTSIRWGVLARLVLVYGLALFALVVAVAVVASAL